MENVEGLMDKRNVAELDNALATLNKKYTVLKPVIIDASEWRAATKRKRVVVIGFDHKRFSPLGLSNLLPPLKTTTVAEAITDIREPIKQKKDSTDFGWASYRRSKNLSQYAVKMRSLPPKGLGSKDAIQYLKEGKLSGHFDTVHTDKVKQRYVQLDQGKTDSVSRAKKLEWNGLCPTLRAGTGSDKGSHQAVRPIHPESGRVITVREAARLQGFPDWFCFHQTKWHSFRMIGNSVSPIISEAILSIIYNALMYEHMDMTA
jgi:DNA (cytosine-5)-methyltransferase 1